MKIMSKKPYSPFLWALLLLIFITGIGCEDSSPDLSIEELYNNSVDDAVFADADEIRTNLLVISENNGDLKWDNGMVLVVTFTHYLDSYPEGETINTWWGDTWVTAVPELKLFFDSIAYFVADPVLRIEQLLGLPMNTGNEWFVELWVSPDDLFRPCPDNEITDSECGLSFPDSATDEYMEWFNNQIIDSYFQEQKYPWTRLGYTYDWNGLTEEFGLSEFIIRQGADVIVEKVQSYKEYLSTN